MIDSGIYSLKLNYSIRILDLNKLLTNIYIRQLDGVTLSGGGLAVCTIEAAEQKAFAKACDRCVVWLAEMKRA